MYTITTPTFDRVTLHLDRRWYPDGDITIETRRAAGGQGRISGMTLGGKQLKAYRISHDQLVKCRKLVITAD